MFLGFAIPDEEMDKVFSMDNFPQVQTHKFNWNIIKGLEHLDVFNFTYISVRPIADYPIFPQKKIKKNKWFVLLGDKRIIIQEIPFINSGIFKIITRFLSALYYSLKNYHLVFNKAGVIVYSVHVPYMIVGLIISKIYNIDYIAIWTDPPAVNINKSSNLKSKLRKIELMISKCLMKKATKVIALTKYLAEDFAPGKPNLIMEGIIDVNYNNYPINKKEEEILETFRIVYTGSLENRYGIKNIVNGFLAMKNKHGILEIYGRGNFEKELSEISEQNNRVKYKGFVSNKEILDIQRKADFLINARSNDEEFVKYSFPSKTLEYMLSGTPLLTTLLPGIPEEYKEYVIILDNNSPEAIAEKLEEVIKYSSYNRNQIGLKAQKFARTKNYINQSEKIINFLKLSM
ncbi:glycosyltransferase [Alkalibacterium sp. f15]|uniref:glycosyltransferase n=1 Tax=Alkalibacterium sp. f15 TaxID=3414029 RepID=UPI003BF88646